MTEALRQIAKGIGAEIAVLSRFPRRHGGEVGLLASDLQSDDGAAPLPRSFARIVLGAAFEQAEPGSTGFGSKVAGDPDPALLSFQNRRRLSDVVVISLGASDTTIDFLELYLADRLPPEQQERVKAVAATVASTWQTRSPGVASNALFRAASSETAPEAAEHILSMENPARLSRTEYRVCLLLSRGNSVSGVQAELGICSSTLRTHLRSVYAKTNTRNLGELMYLLLSVAP